MFDTPDDEIRMAKQREKLTAKVTATLSKIDGIERVAETPGGLVVEFSPSLYEVNGYQPN